MAAIMLLSDRQLVENILNGDKETFRHLVHDYERLVYHIVYRMIREKAVHEDICQDIFIKVYQGLRRFRFDCKLSTWIGKIAYRTCLNHLDKKKLHLVSDFEKIDYTSPAEVSPEQHLEDKDLHQRLEQEIAALPPQFRTLVTLYHADGKTYEEISSILDCPLGTVKGNLYRARKLLKDRLVRHDVNKEVLT